MREQLWPSLSVPPALAHNQVHVWCAPLDQPAPLLRQLAMTLCSEEQARAARFYFERDRNHFIAGRAILRAILGGYLGVDPSHLRFQYGPRGKPLLAEPYSRSELRFNLAHSQGLALYGFTYGREIGVDIEGIRQLDDAEAIAERFFSPRESACFRALPSELKPLGFFNCWTRKEAYLKATGDGLAQPLDSFEVSLSPAEPAQLLSIDGDAAAATRWSLFALVPAPGFVGAMVVEGTDWVLHSWCWEGYQASAALV